MCSTGYIDITNPLQSFRYSMVIIVIRILTPSLRKQSNILVPYLALQIKNNTFLTSFRFSDDQGDVRVALIWPDITPQSSRIGYYLV